MKKFLILSLAVLAIIAMVSVVATAGPACGSKDKTSTTATTASAKASCTPAEAAACASKFGMSKDECEKLCADLGKDISVAHISVQGMTCGGCESSVTKALEAVTGVKRVLKVSHKEGMALVAFENGKVDNTTLTTAVSNTGFKAEIITAVATTTTTDAKDASAHSCSKACGSKGSASCTTAEKKACGGK